MQLRALETVDSKELSFLLIQIHALADNACRGFGILGQKSERTAIVHFLANLLLTTRGSLSTIPKYQGIVVPKMRTPQSGLTIRSFSLHLAYHDTEVEVMWRAIPWMNIDQNHLNILCVPWPNHVRTSEFNSRDETFESVRYFGYDNAVSERSHIHGLIEQIIKLNVERGRIHLVVFPELALTEDDYDYLLAVLKIAYDNGELPFMPMVLSGVRNAQNRPIDSRLDSNHIKLAAFFVGKWYDLSQTKHHRWKLDRHQLMQYELTTKLSTERSWFEKIEIKQRRLSFFVPNGWLALCPLICEDLAQLEPVSEIIRGVGPTMLVALLMDAPQIKERWPARYASIFADDPGTAVLTLTSIGMIGRSLQLGNPKRSNRSSVGLWKDQLNGWRNIEVPKSDGTALLSVSASFKAEVTADGRSDGGFASVFKLDNVYYPGNINPSFQHSMFEQVSQSGAIDQSSIWRGEWLDLRELTSATYAIDALLSLQGQHWDIIRSWIIPIDDNNELVLDCQPGHYAEMIELLVCSYADPALAGISTAKETWPSASLRWGVSEMDKWRNVFEEARKDYIQPTADDVQLLTVVKYYSTLIDHAEMDLQSKQNKEAEWSLMSDEEQDEHRIRKAIPLAILILLHNRLDDIRIRYAQKGFSSIAATFKRIETIVLGHSRFKKD